MRVVYEKLTVRNFGPISNLDIIIRPMTLFIGTQGSGKSTIAKLLTFCRESLWADVRDKLNYTKRLHDYGINDFLYLFTELLMIMHLVGQHQHVQTRQHIGTMGC